MGVHSICEQLTCGNAVASLHAIIILSYLGFSYSVMFKPYTPIVLHVYGQSGFASLGCETQRPLKAVNIYCNEDITESKVMQPHVCDEQTC